MGLDILQMVIVLAILLLLVRPVGTYMAAVFTGKRTVLDRVLARPALTAALAVCALVVLALPVVRCVDVRQWAPFERPRRVSINQPRLIFPPLMRLLARAAKHVR